MLCYKNWQKAAFLEQTVEQTICFLIWNLNQKLRFYISLCSGDDQAKAHAVTFTVINLNCWQNIKVFQLLQLLWQYGFLLFGALKLCEDMLLVCIAAELTFSYHLHMSGQGHSRTSWQLVRPRLFTFRKEKPGWVSKYKKGGVSRMYTFTHNTCQDACTHTWTFISSLVRAHGLRPISISNTHRRAQIVSSMICH